MNSRHAVDDHPSMLWVTIPPVLLLAGYFVRKWYLARQLRLYGIGKGASGFQTNVRQLRITPEIAERMRRGETVSPEEIAEAARKAELNPRPATTTALMSRPDLVEINLPPAIPEPEKNSSSANEWLPENVTSPKKKAKGKRK